MSNSISNVAVTAANEDDCAPAGAFSEQPGGYQLSIGMVAQMFKISVLRLRLYEWRGLIRRECVDGRWVYSWPDCERIALIVKSRQAGIKLREIASIVAAMDQYGQRNVVEDGRHECIELIHTLEGHQQALGTVLHELYRVSWELSRRLDGKAFADVGN
jgi:DNA-binding transcriptional MerR regulator